MSLGDNGDAGTKTAPGGSRRPEPGDTGQEAPWLLRQGEQGLGRGAGNRESRSRDERGEATDMTDRPGLDPESSKSTVKRLFLK